jgi:hypothetical protein
MNPNSNSHDKKPVFIFALAVVGTFLIVALLALALARSEPPALDAVRKAERSKALAELRQAEAQALAHPAWINKDKEIVRLPIDLAMDQVLKAWQNPPAAKAELVARVGKATATPPPAPAKPSEFE